MSTKSIRTWYGSASYFEAISEKELAEGKEKVDYGFCTSNKRNIALQQANETGYLYKIDFIGEKALDNTKITMTNEQIAVLFIKLEQYYKVLSRDKDLSGNEMTNYIGNIIKRLHAKCKNDVDLVKCICDKVGNNRVVFRELYTICGYDHIKMRTQLVSQILYIATVSEAINIREIYSLEKKEVVFVGRII